MARELGIVLFASSFALAAAVGYHDVARRRPRRYLPALLCAAVACATFVLVFADRIETKGSVEETAAVVLCYGAMLLGMAAEYFYTQAERGSRTLSFEPMAFLMPIFASPIVFIPLLTITSEVAIGGGAFTRSKLMVYLVAFQNGFFWKGFFEQRRQAAGQPTPAVTCDVV
jgi:uncharacterized membrane protein YidH (DUF202 family)